MTIDEAYLRFRVSYDAIASLQAPQLEKAEINSIMNQSYMSLIMTLNKSKMYDDLRELTVVEKLDLAPCTIEQLGDYAYQASNLSSSFLYHVSSHVFVVTRSGLLSVYNTWISCDEVARKDIDYWIQQPGNYQIILFPKVFFHFDTINATPIIMADRATVILTTQGYQVAYIKIPVAIDLTLGGALPLCELSPDWHEIIVDQAVSLAVKATDEERLKLNMQQAQQKQQSK